MDYITINKYSLVPLYSQLKESIKEAIQNGILKPGDKLPTEHEICNHFNLSRTVTRQAFYELMSEGYIVRYKSRGTFVNQQSKENVFFKEIISFNDEMKMYGFEPKTELISIEKFICNDYIAEKSEFNVGDELIRIQRLRYRNDDPIVFVDGYYRASDIPEIEKHDLEKESMFYILEKYYNIKVMHTKKRFMARIVEDKYANYLSIKKKSAVQYVESREYNQQDEFVSFDISIYVGKKIYLRQKLTIFLKLSNSTQLIIFKLSNTTGLAGGLLFT